MGSQKHLGVVEVLQLEYWVLNPTPQQDQVPPQDAEPQEPPEHRPLECPQCQVLYSEVHGLGY